MYPSRESSYSCRMPPSAADSTASCPEHPTTDTPITGQPLFIVGLPRRAFIAIERIPCSHSTVQTAGEPSALSQVRQSLYDPSLTQWRHYAAQLADIEVES